MEPQFQTSFIPKKALADDRAVSARPVSLWTFLATIVFIASVIAAGIVYFMQAGLARGISQKKQQLDTAAGAFEKDFIAEIQTTGRRIGAANEVLGGHIIVSPVFESLQASTLKSVQFTRFTYTTSGSGVGATVQISMSGKAQSYTSIALQSDKLAENKYIKNPVFSNLTLDEQSNVIFDLTFSVDPHLVSFGESLSRLPGSTDANQQSVTSPITQP